MIEIDIRNKIKNNNWKVKLKRQINLTKRPENNKKKIKSKFETITPHKL